MIFMSNFMSNYHQTVCQVFVRVVGGGLNNIKCQQLFHQKKL